LHRCRLLGVDWHGEPLDPLEISLCLGRHLGDAAPGTQPGLHLTRAHGRGALSGPSLLRDTIGKVAGFVDLGQQLLVEDEDETASLGSRPRGKDQPVVISRVSDEMELLHRRSQGGGLGGRARMQSSSLTSITP